MPDINPTILKWARIQAGLSLAQAAQSAKIGDTKRAAGEARLDEFESGLQHPTRPQLVRLAATYRRPLLTFYLSEPPVLMDQGQDFRTLPADQRDQRTPYLDALIRRLLARQSIIREILIDEDQPPLGFVGSASTNDRASTVAASMSDVLGMSYLEHWKAKNANEAFSLLRSAVESLGVFVSLTSDLGSHHTRIDLDAFRGFTIADQVAPLIAINDQDSRAAWSFTLLHELTHLWLGQTGLGGRNVQQKIEKFCNDVASEFLLPAHELARFSEQLPYGENHLESEIAAFAQKRNISRSMVAYRLYRVGRIDENTWHRVSLYFRQQWRDSTERERQKNKSEDRRINGLVVRRHRLGKHLVELVNRSLSEGAMSTTRAGIVLGVKPGSVRSLIDAGR